MFNIERFYWVVFRSIGVLAVLVLVSALVAACGGGDGPEATPTSEPSPTAEQIAAEGQVNLAAIKDFSLGHATSMKGATEQLAATADQYYTLISGAGFDYELAFEQNPDELRGLVETAREQWVDASTEYEVNEGIIAGVPSLAYYDVWIDAGPSGDEDPAEALDWELELPDGTVLDKPGNLFHSLLEPTLWGTRDDFTGAKLDLDGDGEVGFEEILPDADVFKGAADALDHATGEMATAVTEWQPTLQDVFTAQVTMIPTMNEYFAQWKNSVYVAGAAEADETAFVGLSRLFDINGILTGLSIAYKEMSPAVSEVDLALDTQITGGFTALVQYVHDLYEKEQNGEHFTPEQADLFGTEAQDRATALAGQVSQAAALLGVEISE